MASTLEDDVAPDPPILSNLGYASSLAVSSTSATTTVPALTSDPASSDSVTPSIDRASGFRNMLENDESESQVDSGALLSSLSNMVDQLSKVDSKTATSLTGAVLGALNPALTDGASLAPEVQQAIESRMPGIVPPLIPKIADLLGEDINQDPVLESYNVNGALNNIVHQGNSIIDQITKGNGANIDPEVLALLDHISGIINTASGQLSDPVCVISNAVNDMPTQIVVPCANAGVGATTTIVQLVPSAVPSDSEAQLPTSLSQPGVGGTVTAEGSSDQWTTQELPAGPDRVQRPYSDPNLSHPQVSPDRSQVELPEDQGLSASPPQPNPSQPNPPQVMPGRLNDYHLQTSPEDESSPCTDQNSDSSQSSPTTGTDGGANLPFPVPPLVPSSVPQSDLPTHPTSPVNSAAPIGGEDGGSNIPKNYGGEAPPKSPPAAQWSSPGDTKYPQIGGMLHGLFKNKYLLIYA